MSLIIGPLRGIEWHEKRPVICMVFCIYGSFFVLWGFCYINYNRELLYIIDMGDVMNTFFSVFY